MISGMLFKRFVEFLEQIESRKSRTEKVNLIVDLLLKLKPEEIAPAVRLMVGRIFPEYSDLSLDAGWSLISKALKTTRSVNMLLKKELTVLEVYNLLEKVAQTVGEDSRRRKQRIFERIFVNLEEKEIEYLFRMIFGEPRLGANEGLVLEAIAKLVDVDVSKVRKAYMFISDIGHLAHLAVKKGAKGILNVNLQLFRPVKPMLAEMAQDVREALKECGGRASLEYKYDGIRLQVHKRGKDIKLFTRRLTDVTESLPDVVKLVEEKVHADEVVLDSEAISFKEGKPIRFQDLMRRIRRKHGIEKLAREMPLTLKVFDILYIDGKVLVDLPYSKRWEIMTKVVDDDILIERIVTNDLEEARKFFNESVKMGNEGLMVKRIDSPYTPGVRGRYWFKVKPSETLDLVIVGAEWGHGRRKGWLSDYYLAVFDEKTNKFMVVGKTFKGLSDEEFKEMTRKLLAIKVKEEGWRVWVRPKIVVEVAFNEIQKSPKYKSGYALRFARIVRLRYDKSSYEVATLETLRKIYENQFKSKAKITS